MKLSRTVSYAVQAALQLAQSSTRDPRPCSRIATEGKMPERFLLQILRSMVTHGVLHSTRGVDGGYSLDRAPEDISLLNIFEAIEGPIAANVPAAEGLSEESREQFQNAIENVTAMVREQLEYVKLSHLMISVKRKPTENSQTTRDPPLAASGPHFSGEPRATLALPPGVIPPGNGNSESPS